MKVGYKKLGLVLGAVAAVALMPARVDAQMVRYSPIFWSFEAGGGMTIPMGDLADNSKSGGSMALGAGYFLNPRLALTGQGGLSFMGDTDAAATAAPELKIWTFMGGIEYHFADPTGNLLFAMDLGLGGGTFDTKVFTVSDFPSAGASTSGNFQKTRMAASGGLKLGYNFARHSATGVPMVTLYIDAAFQAIFLDETDTQLFAALNGMQPFGTAMLIPVTAGLRVNIP
jgi:hypothetical protein